jgi:diguanylate cyclase (GGDEF)-like protein
LIFGGRETSVTKGGAAARIGPDLAQAAIEAMPAAIAVIGKDGRVVATNEAWRKDERAGVGETLSSLAGAQQAAAEIVDEAVDRVLNAGTPSVELELPEAGPDGRRWSLLHLARLPRGGAVASQVDVTRSHEVLDLVSASAVRDPLTGLPHRALIEDRIESALARSERGSSVPAVLFLDLDHFKAVNDEHGHQVGDQVLAAVARRVSAVLRASDTCGRWGGDEFVVVVDLEPDRVEVDLGLVLERICATVASPIEVEGILVEIGLSVGAVIVAPGDTGAELTAMADRAMYDAKRSGTCHVVVDRHVLDLRSQPASQPHRA